MTLILPQIGFEQWTSSAPGGGLPSPIGYWKFDDGSGTTAVDSSGNGNNGTLYGSAPPSWTTGKFSGALQFDGSQNYVDFGRPTGFVTPSAFTLAAWIYPTTYPGGLDFVAGIEYMYGLAFNNTGYNLIGGVVNSGNNAHVDNSAVLYIPVNTWHHICLTWEGANWTVYIDGVSRAGPTAGTMGSSSWNFTAGCLGGHGGYQDKFFAGKIDELRFYNVCLGSTDVSTLYNLIP